MMMTKQWFMDVFVIHIPSRACPMSWTSVVRAEEPFSLEIGVVRAEKPFSLEIGKPSPLLQLQVLSVLRHGSVL
jgi:hypothetical protein